MVYQGITFRGSPSGKIVQSSFTRDSLAADEVVIKVTHSGVCGSELHFLHNDMVLGHEGIGVVQEVGSACKRIKVGDRVGWGFNHSSCGYCDHCLSGPSEDQYCKHTKMFSFNDLDQGSFSNLSIRKEEWLFVIPDGLSSEHAAPLMCAGATVFTPIIDHVKPIDRIGIVGIGGLGHLAIQFAAKMGCDVVVFSSSESKRKEALALGASEFYATKGVANLADLGMKKPVKHLLLANSGSTNLGMYYPLLDEHANILLTTYASGDLVTSHPEMTFRGISIIGTKIASRYTMNKLLDFAARNKIAPYTETFPMSVEGAETAIKKLQDGTMRYRGVLVVDKA
ncbi:nadp-dependent alcohol dehydrogenase [Moniliophthora roreri MCA 2997]|uniref:Nadp-dependent alcohol dehydrogenase n=2 Tax=Moniliophthora roreri TaxID=221103 RepID=V2WTK0_MONRO|nr:nadp-dependent alcohol dehydrogenase [Moniliophthora roreri MCA 2997]KAI3608169.1 nadp-dependent alcohol dehydrogenase [Moniliophthora roreri]